MADRETRPRRRGPSLLMLVVGVVGLALAGTTLAGGHIPGIHTPWIAIGIAVIVGLALVLSPLRG